MSYTGITGKVFETYGEVLVEWQIPDFCMIPVPDVDCFFISPLFYGCDACWSLKIYPKGMKDYPDWVGVGLMRLDKGPPKTVRISFGIKTADGVEQRSPEITYSPFWNFARNAPKFILKSDLLDRKSELTPSGVLTVTCSLTETTQRSSEVSLCSRLWKLSSDLKKMLREGKGTDFVVKLKSGEFQAHRAILEARSPYFSGMLSSDCQENRTGEGDIGDIEEGVFQCVLSYMYTGEVEELSIQNVCKIYVAADKLLLERLKTLCTDYMKKNLSLDLICDVIEIVEVYEEEELEELALEYITQHADEVFESDRWKEFKVEKTALVPGLLEKFVVKGRNI